MLKLQPSPLSKKKVKSNRNSYLFKKLNLSFLCNLVILWLSLDQNFRKIKLNWFLAIYILNWHLHCNFVSLQSILLFHLWFFLIFLVCGNWVLIFVLTFVVFIVNFLVYWEWINIANICWICWILFDLLIVRHNKIN